MKDCDGAGKAAARAGRRKGVLILMVASPVLLSEGRGAIEGLSTGTAAFIGTAERGESDRPTLVQGRSEFLGLFGEGGNSLMNPYLEGSVSAFFSNGGRRAYVVRVAGGDDESYIGLDDPSLGRTGLQTLRGIDEVSIVCAPGITTPRVQQALIRHCEEMGDRFAVLDGEVGDLEPVQRQRQILRSDNGYAGLYYPWVQAASGGLLPPSGFVAGVYARVDREAGVWKAPVGPVAGALDLSRAVSQGEQEVLNSAGINVLRKFPDRGIQVWGARTIASQPDWQYVSVRRYLIYLEESIAQGTQWAVFEPNDESLWLRLRSEVEEFLLGLWRQGALQGTKPEQAFFAQADRVTMTQDDLDQGRTVILIGVAVLRPAEFTIFRVVQERKPPGPLLRRGDGNLDGFFDLSDPLATLGYLFLGTTPPGCLQAADLDGNGALDVNDAVYGLSFLFLGGPAPAEPFQSCGPAAPAGVLDCGQPPPCG